MSDETAAASQQPRAAAQGRAPSGVQPASGPTPLVGLLPLTDLTVVAGTGPTADGPVAGVCSLDGWCGPAPDAADPAQGAPSPTAPWP